MYVGSYAICVFNWNWLLTQDHFLITHWSQHTDHWSARVVGLGAGQPLQHGEVRDTNLAWVRPVTLTTTDRNRSNVPAAGSETNELNRSVGDTWFYDYRKITRGNA